jgi:uncharacterized Zn-binding protein involved in type VI secretion
MNFAEVAMAPLTQSVHSTIESFSKASDSVASNVIAPVAQNVFNAPKPASAQPTPPPNPAKAVQAVAGTIMGVLNLPNTLIDTGVAAVGSMAESALAALGIPMPAFPAATLGMPYIGINHAHAHPPSLVPPPVPLFSLGAITLGTCVKVLIGGMPAARAGDLGMAPTCGGLAPFFVVKLGSSKVFFGGGRAARMSDMCTACTKGEPRNMSKLDFFISSVGVASDVIEVANADSAASAAASTLAAAMGAAQMAADAIAMALSQTMGTDPAIPPALPGFVAFGNPMVLVGGFPVPATGEIAKWLKNKLKALKAKLGGRGGKKSASEGGGVNCPP